MAFTFLPIVFISIPPILIAPINPVPWECYCIILAKRFYHYIFCDVCVNLNGWWFILVFHFQVPPLFFQPFLCLRIRPPVHSYCPCTFWAVFLAFFGAFFFRQRIATYLLFLIVKSNRFYPLFNGKGDIFAPPAILTD